MESPKNIIDSGQLPNPIADSVMVGQCSDPQQLIYLSLGETWEAPAKGLLDALQHVPDYSHGYTLSPYGLPALRRELLAYIIRTHQLPPPEFYDVAVSQSGTRGAMSDFASWINADNSRFRKALVPSPGWDYEGILQPLGFDVRHYTVTKETNWQPVPEQIIPHLDCDTLFVINAQHNPTGVQWNEAVLGILVSSALERNTAILIDDAYYGVHAPEQPPSNVLKILIEQIIFQNSKTKWLAVRTLGKQFKCNGWGIGAMTAARETLSAISDVTHRRSYGSGLPLQAAMAAWLNSHESDLYVAQIRKHYADNRDFVSQYLIKEMGYPEDAIIRGNCTSYIRFMVPERFICNADEEFYRQLCLQVGVLPGRGSMTSSKAFTNHSGNDIYVRIHLGHQLSVLNEALYRMHQVALDWSE